MCIIEPSDRSQKPLIEMALEGRHFFVAAFPGVCTIGVTHITVEIYSHEYNMYYGAIRQGSEALDRNGARGQALFRSCISGVGTIGMVNIIIKTHL